MNKFYLSFSLIGSATYVIWGYIVSLTNPDIIIDSFSHRFLIVFPFFMLILIYIFFKKINIEYLAYLGVFGITADYCYLASMNNNIIHTTGLYVVLSASLAVIHNKLFLWTYSLSFALYCLYSIVFKSSSALDKTHWAMMLTLISLATFFGLWRIRSLEQLGLEYLRSLDKSKKLEELNNIAVQAAHDIRSPVMVLESFVSSVKELEPHKLKIITDSAIRFNKIADDLVEQYRKKYLVFLEPSDHHPTNVIENQSVSELVEQIRLEKLLLQSDYRKFEIKIQHEIKFIINDVKLYFDIKRILSNIINNSIESFEDSAGIIEIILSEDQTWYTIEIKDNGKGISPELVSKVFVKGARFGKPKGSGIGLSSAKELIEKYRGDISFKSKLGTGSLVRLTFNKL